MTGTFARGLIAGAAGTTALSAATYLDMAWRGRPPSTLPAETADALAEAAGRPVTGRGDTREARRTGLGALSGIGSGLGVGLLASVARSAGVRFPAPVGAVVTGAASMAAADLPAAALSVGDPRRWTAAEWAGDAAPHLAYGAAVQAVISSLPTPAERALPRHKARAGLVGRSLLLGVAAGSRSALGVAAPTLTAQDTGALKKLGSLASLTAELVADKQPDAPPRTSGAGLPVRLTGGACGGGLLARRAGANAALPVVAGLAGVVVGTWGGLGWRRWAADRMPDGEAALLEDGVAIALSLVACLPGRRRSTRLGTVRIPDRPRATPGRGR
ncbi:hypothetical protein [Modestobacter marinus]|uniref:hypothetical protein n=1 Tax=Modestobacter marinus TaxID=477641 RepID=UPI001C93BC0C|nr:hypothetical protein [Modestobacter marinus]